MAQPNDDSMTPKDPRDSTMVVAVQCPDPNCRKYMLIEERDCAKVVVCLLCKTPFHVDAEQIGFKKRRPEESSKPETH